MNHEIKTMLRRFGLVMMPEKTPIWRKRIVHD